MPAVCQLRDALFEYPENWDIDDDATGEDGHAVVVSPGTGVWQVSQYPVDADIESLFDEALSALRKEYRGMEVSPATDMIDGRPLDGFDVTFIYLDLIVTVWLRGYRSPQSLFLIMCQGEDRELEQLGPVFHAISASLMRSAK
ncbi:MAG: hypothetical protein KF688_03395 [Pirellulales bacterium]|nr:hypothetical protein [Pirellulales bacterium]